MDPTDIGIPCVLSAIPKLGDKISLTPESIPSYFLKRAASRVCFPLCLLFQASLSAGFLPKPWKSAIVLPLVKKPPAVEVANYRRISLTSPVCKVLEFIVKQSLFDHFSSLNLLRFAQHGFRPGFSTLTQLLLTSADLIAAYNDRIQTDVVYIDFAKAFDVVCHRRLLQAYGVSGALLNWLAAYLIERSFRAKVGNAFSDEFPNLCGVPQGSVLGPFLFRFYQ